MHNRRLAAMNNCQDTMGAKKVQKSAAANAIYDLTPTPPAPALHFLSSLGVLGVLAASEE
jgi:hypothetical protein